MDVPGSSSGIWLECRPVSSAAVLKRDAIRKKNRSSDDNAGPIMGTGGRAQPRRLRADPLLAFRRASAPAALKGERWTFGLP
jgi:hypothetical protein